MKITNELGLPEALVRAVQADDYTKGEADFSATELLKPAHQWQLLKKHDDHPDLSEDVADRLWALLGKIGHKILEDHAPEDYVTEERLYREIEVDGETYKISGQMDVQRDAEHGWMINDWKFTSFGTLIYGEYPKDDWVHQLNIYQWLRGEPTYLQITALLRDFKKSMVGQTLRGAKRPYPNKPVVIVEIPSWSLDRTEDFIRERIRYLLSDVTECSKEERWGGTRCKDWCAVAGFCDFYHRDVL